MATTVSYLEWLRMPEVRDATEEVIDGEIRITPPAKWVHAEAVSKIYSALLGQFAVGKFAIATAQFGLVIRKEPLTVRVPDLAVFELSTIVEEDGFIHSPPQLAAEVLAPGEDISRKLADYASLGVPEIWVISPESRTVEVLSWKTVPCTGGKPMANSRRPAFRTSPSTSKTFGAIGVRSE